LNGVITAVVAGGGIFPGIDTAKSAIFRHARVVSLKRKFLRRRRMSPEKVSTGFEKMAVLGMALSLLIVSFDLAARERRGAWLKIEKLDGFRVEGELLKVSGETLFLYHKDNRHNVHAGLSEVRNLEVRREKRALSGIVIGLGYSIVASQLVSGIAWRGDGSDAAMGFMFLTIYSAQWGCWSGD
jgi:hypothetical protein